MQYCDYSLMGKVCDECSQQLKDDSDLAAHLNQYHRRSFCAACKKEFDNPEALQIHVKNVHGLHHNI
jgi:hypothetical protein